MLHLILWWWGDGAGGVTPPATGSELPIRGLIVMHPIRHPVSDVRKTDRYEA